MCCANCQHRKFDRNKTIGDCPKVENQVSRFGFCRHYLEDGDQRKKMREDIGR
jgi:hypothetical protein